jgi:Tol biopolymer transport system component
MKTKLWISAGVLAANLIAAALAVLIGGVGADGWRITYASRVLAHGNWTLHVMDARARLTIDLYRGVDFPAYVLNPPSPSPDLRYVSWSDRGLEVRTYDSHTGEMIDLGAYSYPVWSPDGRRFAYHGAELDLYVTATDEDGTMLPPLRVAQENPSRPAWCCGGSRLAYIREPNSVRTAIDVIGWDDQTAAPLASVSQGYIRRLAWSPDGTRLAFSSDAPSTRSAMYTVRVPGGEPERIGQFAFFEILRLAWSPDGQHVAFSALNAPLAPVTVWIARVDEGELIGPVARLSQRDSALVWSPSGRDVAYTRSSDGGNVEIYAVRLAPDRTWRTLRLTFNDRMETLLP